MDDNILVGRIITDFKIAQDKKALLFKTDKGDVIVHVEGDCCSDSWVEHIELPAMGFPAKVTLTEDLRTPEPVQDAEYDVLSFYGFKIETDKGTIIIDYRNSSNGYYGGSLSWPDSGYYPDGGVYNQNTSEEVWVPINTD